MPAKRRRAFAALALLAAAGCSPPSELANLSSVTPAPTVRDWASRESIIELAPRPGVTLRALLLKPGRETVGSVIILTGGDGRVGLERWRPGLTYGNFVVRSRMHFAAEGFVVAVMEAPSDQSDGMKGFRLGAQHAADLKALILRLRAENGGPVWVVGTSMGTISATHGVLAAGADGAVLTSSISLPSQNYPFSVLSFPLEDIRAPVLIFHHWRDACRFSSWHGTEEIRARLVNSRKAERMAVDGGDSPQGDPCEPRGAHGFPGIERQAVALMSNWMKAATR